ncbi:unnamed protein product, partial [Mycena citricolor]
MGVVRKCNRASARSTERAGSCRNDPFHAARRAHHMMSRIASHTAFPFANLRFDLLNQLP